MAVGFMEVHLVKTKGLEDKDFLGKMDPYVLIQYKSQEKKSSVAKGKGSNPTWNERFTFKVEYPGSGGEYKLILRIMDKDTVSADDFVGKATIYVEELLARGSENGTAELHPSKYRVVNAENNYYGEIEVGVTFTLKKEEERNEKYGGWKESSY